MKIRCIYNCDFIESQKRPLMDIKILRSEELIKNQGNTVIMFQQIKYQLRLLQKNVLVWSSEVSGLLDRIGGPSVSVWMNQRGEKLVEHLVRTLPPQFNQVTQTLSSFESSGCTSLFSTFLLGTLGKHRCPGELKGTSRTFIFSTKRDYTLRTCYKSVRTFCHQRRHCLIGHIVSPRTSNLGRLDSRFEVGIHIK